MPRSNIIEAGTAEIAELFEDYIELPGEAASCIALTLSSHALGDAARDAVGKSLAALGYGQDACTYATLVPIGQEAATAGSDAALDAQALFLLLEGLDPLCVIVADGTCADRLAQAYRTAYEHDSAVRVFGRPSVAFEDLERLLETNEGKQRAWHLFKSLR